MGLQVLTGLDTFGRVTVKFSDGTKLTSKKYDKHAYKVQTNKKGNYITIDKTRHYIEIPDGKWVSDGKWGHNWISEN